MGGVAAIIARGAAERSVPVFRFSSRPRKEPVTQSVFITYLHAHHPFPAEAGSHLSADETSPDREQVCENRRNSVPYRTLDPGFRRESEGAKCEIVTVFSNMPIGLQARKSRGPGLRAVGAALCSSQGVPAFCAMTEKGAGTKC